MRSLLFLFTSVLAASSFAQELEGWATLSGAWKFAEGEMTSDNREEAARYVMVEPVHDFTLEFEYRGGDKAEASVHFRTHWLPDESNLQASRFYGYRLDLVPSDPKATGTIHEIYTPRQLVLASPDAQATLKVDDWNSVKIETRGEVVSLWLNGVKASHVVDEAFIAGHIAFKTEKGSGIRFRNIKVTKQPRYGQWRSLFNGRSLKGWTVYGSERFDVESGTIIGRSGPKKSEGYLLTDESFTDFRVKGQFKMLGEGNFGLFYRSKITLREEDGYPVIAGVQGEVDPKFPGPSGWHYESYRRGWLHENPQPASMRAYAAPPNEWGEIEIRAVGNRTTSWVNGIRIVDFYDDNPQVFDGGFALQLHAGGVDGIQWKELYVQDAAQY